MRETPLLDWFLGRLQKPAAKETQKEPERRDPLDLFARDQDDEWRTQPTFETMQLVGAEKFPVYEPINGNTYAMDSASKKLILADDATQSTPLAAIGFGVPDVLQGWYSSQGFIGHQACAIIAQHWLVDKACTMPAEDAIRQGFDLNVVNGEEGGDQAEEVASIRKRDAKFNVVGKCVEFARFTNIFGIRICIFEVDSKDPLYYEKPFNIDGVTKGAYKGMRQVDPYWCFPVLSMKGQADPSSMHFYEPEYWVVNGKKYHRSHLVIGRGPEVADVLKPTYLFGGVSIPQRIFERVYAAERTANEGPLLAMTKRTTTVHVDLSKAAAKQKSFVERIREWISYRDNMQVRVLGTNEQIEQSDTSLADLDSVIMTQYQLVSAISGVPATKLLGTSPKGFSATGEFEESSYHEKLESVQAGLYVPLLSRHYELLIKSEFDGKFAVDIVMKPVDSPSAKELAEINKAKADAGKVLVDGGVISPDEERDRVRSDPDSGYSFINTEEADTEIGTAEPAEQRGESSQQGGFQDAIHAPGFSPKLPKMKIHGFTVVIENPKGSVRSGMNLDGSVWNIMMPHHYGYISGVLGADGDELDAFIGPAVASQLVFVINQNDPTQNVFDEHKVMLGFESAMDACKAYSDAFSDDWEGMGSCIQMTLDEFRAWLATGDTTKEIHHEQ